MLGYFRVDKSFQAAVTKKYPEVDVPNGILEADEMRPTSNAIEPVILSKEEELLNGPPAYLWNYLRRSGMVNFLLTLRSVVRYCQSAGLLVFCEMWHVFSS